MKLFYCMFTYKDMAGGEYLTLTSIPFISDGTTKPIVVKE
ncbi:hypothetical protein bcere0022_19520 [Bacillus cereus Rock3-44]|nr:hypothetical protein bcere0022_19520 [Bacillus cereus Rock3-44]